MTDSRPRVFILDMNAFDYAPAEIYGDLVMLHGDPLAPGSGLELGDGLWNMDVLNNLRKQLLDYQPGIDYLLPTGKPLKMCVISMLVRNLGDHHRFLVWDKKYYRYIPYTIKL
jgi:hypothetical protein